MSSSTITYLLAGFNVYSFVYYLGSGIDLNLSTRGEVYDLGEIMFFLCVFRYAARLAQLVAGSSVKVAWRRQVDGEKIERKTEI